MSELQDKYGADWANVLRRQIVDTLRTGLRLRYRHACNDETQRLEAAMTERFWDCVNLGAAPELSTLADIEDFAKFSRKELFTACGWEDVSNVIEHYEEGGAAPSCVALAQRGAQ